MSTDDFDRNDPESTFTFGVRELRQASETREVRPARMPPSPRLATVPYKPAKAAPAQGFDPYNSGGFDRKRGWSRIRKR